MQQFFVHNMDRVGEICPQIIFNVLVHFFFPLKDDEQEYTLFVRGFTFDVLRTIYRKISLAFDNRLLLYTITY